MNQPRWPARLLAIAALAACCVLILFGCTALQELQKPLCEFFCGPDKKIDMPPAPPAPPADPAAAAPTAKLGPDVGHPFVDDPNWKARSR